MQHCDFGRTGHASSRMIFGAAALWSMDQEEADETIGLIRAGGINHIDTAASYGDSELRLAPFLADHRAQVFLATKTEQRSGSAARAELERSFERLGVAEVDLIQLHNLVDEVEWAQAMGPGGALEAMVQARDEGLVKWIGVTGHGITVCDMHVRSLDEFDFDSVLFPFNPTLMSNPAYAASATELRARCADRNIAVQAIKSIAVGRWAPDHAGPRHSWYEPLTDRGAIGRAVGYVLGDGQMFLNTTSDATILPALLDFADEFPEPTEAEIAADIERFGMTALFDDGELATI